MYGFAACEALPPPNTAERDCAVACVAAEGSSACRHTKVVTPAASSGFKLFTISAEELPGCGPCSRNSCRMMFEKPGPASGSSLWGKCGGSWLRAMFSRVT